MVKGNRLIASLAGLVAIGIIHSRSRSYAVGKLEDYKPVPWGRIDTYWMGLLAIDPLSTIGRDPGNVTKNEVDPEQAVKDFGLRGIEFGNWMSQQDRIDALHASVVSVKDLARVLSIPYNKIGRNRLSIALGARGKSRAKAHYEPGNRWTINLTKFGGKNSLAHEYGHFLDNYIASRYYQRLGFLSGGHSISKRVDPGILKRKRGPQYHMEMIFQILYWRPNGQPTDFYDIQMNRTPYYQMRTEVWARCFEAYIYLRLKELGITNHWLVKKHPAESWPPLHLVKKAKHHIRSVLMYAYK